MRSLALVAPQTPSQNISLTASQPDPPFSQTEASDGSECFCVMNAASAAAASACTTSALAVLEGVMDGHSPLPKDWTREIWQALQVEASSDLSGQLEAVCSALKTLLAHVDGVSGHSCRSEQLELVIEVLQMLQLGDGSDAMVRLACL